MDIYADPAYAMACEQFAVIADYLNLDANMRARMLHPKRAIAARPIRYAVNTASTAASRDADP